MVVSGSPPVGRRVKLGWGSRGVFPWALLVLICPLSPLVALFMAPSGTVQDREVSLPAADQAVTTQPFDLNSVSEAVTIKTVFTPPDSTLLYLSTELLDASGKVVFQHDIEGLGTATGSLPDEAALSRLSPSEREREWMRTPNYARPANDHSVRFRPAEAGSYQLRFQAYLPRNREGDAIALSGPVLVRTRVSTTPVNRGMLVLTFLMSGAAALMFLSKVYRRGRIQCSGRYESLGQAGRASRGDYRAGLLALRARVAFSQGYETNFQHEAKQYWSFGVRVTDGEGNLLYRGSAPVDKSTVSLADSTLNLVIFPQLFQLTKDCNLRFDLLPPESSANLQFDSVCIEVCDKVKLAWPQDVVRLDP